MPTSREILREIDKYTGDTVSPQFQNEVLMKSIVEKMIELEDKILALEAIKPIVNGEIP